MKIKLPFLKTLKKIFPDGLYTRSLIIIIAPIVILQAILTFVFLERHWQLVTKKLSSSVVSEVGMMIDMLENSDFEIISFNAKKFYDVNLKLLPNELIPKVCPLLPTYFSQQSVDAASIEIFIFVSLITFCL